ncbi:MAG: hypothetical protein MUD10_04625 [Candidatus Pacebacteria bacterium]|jgi:apolipoprotein N-acyltransferase|nr:hypothetical protein [Candidatus Paceibacterota bacterium]
MFEDISFGDFVKVFSIMAVLGLLLIGAIDGMGNLGRTNKRYKDKIIDFIFGIDIFLTVWFAVSFLCSLVAGLGAIVIIILLPPAIVLFAGMSLVVKPVRKYKYVIIGAIAAGIVATYVFIDGIRGLGFDVLFN